MKGFMKTPFEHGGNVFAIARALGIPPSEILDFSANINPLGPAPGVRDALQDAFDSLVHYPDSDCTGLREAVAVSHGVKPASICIGNGSTELIYLLPRLAARKRALVIAPSFSEYAMALLRDDCHVEYLVLGSSDGFAMPMDLLQERLHDGFDLCIIGNPGNPTGRLYLLAEVKEILRLCRAAGSLLVIDEAFMDFCEEESAKHMAAEMDGIIVLRSMTKFHAMPGLRLGYAVASKAIIERIASLREPWSVNTPAQAAGLASLADGEYAAATRKMMAAARQQLMAGLAAIPGLRPFPTAANFVLVQIVHGPLAGELAERLIEERILIRNCANFKGLDDRFFRVAVRGRGENDRLLKALAAAIK
jgi:threonine-phosphate decarboxylase